jgi:hypothetical protein
MLTIEDLLRSTPEVEQALRDLTLGLDADQSAPRALRDVAVLFQLDAEVRSGGFAHYFFHESCPNAFDAWFATAIILKPANQILELAFLRLGSEFDAYLNLRALLESRGGNGMGPAYADLLGIHKQAREGPGEEHVKFATFRESLAMPRGKLSGFDELDARFSRETALPVALVGYAKANPPLFVDR